MKRMKEIERCIDCGSEAVETVVDNVMPAFKMTKTSFACGAVFTSVFSANGNVARVEQDGCMADCLALLA